MLPLVSESSSWVLVSCEIKGGDSVSTRSPLSKTRIMSSPSQRTPQVFPFTKSDRFAVVKKQPRWLRHRCDFKFLHPTRESAEVEALRLTEIHKAKFYIVEIVGITSSTDAEIEEMGDKTPGEQARTVAHLAEVYTEKK
jgi:hypothetical protein